MLKISGLLFERQGKDDNFSIALPTLELLSGQVVAVSGQSGCGKSTLLEILGLILPTSQIEVYRLDGFDLSTLLNQAHSLTAKESRLLSFIRAKYIGFMLQSGGLLPFVKVKDNINISNTILNNKVDTDWLAFLIDKLGVAHLLNKYPKQLSIGERQRVSFIRSIAHKPRLLLADEPTASLDPANAAVLTSLIVELVNKLDIAAVIVTHQDIFTNRDSLRMLVAQTAVGSATTFLEMGVAEEPVEIQS